MVGESARWILPLFAHCGGGLSSKGQNWCQKRLFNYVHRQLFKHDVWLPCSNLLKMILGIFLFFDVIFLTLMKSLGLIADTPICQFLSKFNFQAILLNIKVRNRNGLVWILEIFGAVFWNFTPWGGAGRGVNFCDFELSRTILNQKYQNFSKGIKFYLSWHQQTVTSKTEKVSLETRYVNNCLMHSS